MFIVPCRFVINFFEARRHRFFQQPSCCTLQARLFVYSIKFRFDVAGLSVAIKAMAQGREHSLKQ
jgi:hypothetical protein